MSKKGRRKKARGEPTRGEGGPVAPAGPGFFDRHGSSLVWGMMGLYAAVFITLSLIKYAYFLYNDFDLAIFSQACYTTMHGSFHSSILGINYLGNHTSFVMLLITPVYAVFRHPVTLLALQTVVLSLGAVPVHRLARRELKNEFVAVCFAALYLLYPALGYSNLYEFHPETLTTTTLLFTFYFLWVGRFGPMLLFALLSLMVKENVPPVVAMMGVYVLLLKRPRRWLYSVTLVGLAVLFLVLSFGVVLPTLNKGEVGRATLYAHWGDSMGEALANMAKSPLKTAKAFFVTTSEDHPNDSRNKQEYYVHLLLPVMLLSLMSPLTLAIALPAVAQHLLSSRPSEHTILFHYTAQVTPFVLASAVLGMRNVLRLMMRGIPGGLTDEVMSTRTPPRTLACILSVLALVTAAGSGVLFGPVVGQGVLVTHPPPQGKWPSGYDRAMAPYMRAMTARVPADANAASGFRFLARLAHRPVLYTLHLIYKGTYDLSDKPFPVPKDVGAVLVDTHDWRYMSFFRPDGGSRLRGFFEGNNLRVVDAAGDVVLLLRDGEPALDLCETGDFSPEVRRPVGYNRQVMFLGRDRFAGDVEPGGRLPLRTYWRRTGAVERIYSMQLLLLDGDGRVAFGHQRWIGYSFFPAHDWPYETTVRETFNLVVPNDVKPGNYVLCLRVVEGRGSQMRPAPPDDPEVRRQRGLIRLGPVTVVRPGP